MERFTCYRTSVPENKGFVIGLRLRNHCYLGWLGYGKPVWWKPRLLWKWNDCAGKDFGFGWLLLCFRVKIVPINYRNNFMKGEYCEDHSF